MNLNNPFIRIIQHTPAWILVGSVAATYAVLLFLAALRYRKGGSLPRLGEHICLYLFPFAGLSTISVAAWQFVTQETGWWVLVLIGTLISAFVGLAFKELTAECKKANEPATHHYLWYVAVMMGLTSIGAWVFADSAKMTGQPIHPLIFLGIWVGLAALEVWVGKATYWYFNELNAMRKDWQVKLDEAIATEKTQKLKDEQEAKNAQSELAQLQKQRASEAEAQRVKDEEERKKAKIIPDGIRGASAILSRDGTILSEDRQTLDKDLTDLLPRISEKDLVSSDKLASALETLYRRSMPKLSTARRKVIIENATKVITARIFSIDNQQKQQIHEQIGILADRLFTTENADNSSSELRDLLVEQYDNRFSFMVKTPNQGNARPKRRPTRNTEAEGAAQPVKTEEDH